MVSVGSKFDLGKLRNLYDGNSSASAVLDHFARRERNRRTTAVDRIQSKVSAEGVKISRWDVINVFRGLQECGCGSFLVGRRGWPSRFKWDVKMVEVGQAAARETEQVEEVSLEESEEENEDDNLFKHTFRLRIDQSVTVELPKDLTSQEAVRMARFIETLPFQGNTIDEPAK